jgi:hypothetical protein
LKTIVVAVVVAGASSMPAGALSPDPPIVAQSDRALARLTVAAVARCSTLEAVA